MIKLIDGDFVFKLHDEQGFPTDLSADKIHSMGLSVNWRQYVDSAFSAGWTFDKTIQTVLNCTGNQVALMAAIYWNTL
jgi:alanyl-tRNA synthetase